MTVGGLMSFEGGKRKYAIMAEMVDYGPRETATGTNEIPKRHFVLGVPITPEHEDIEVFITGVSDKGQETAAIYVGQDKEIIYNKLLQDIIDATADK